MKKIFLFALFVLISVVGQAQGAAAQDAPLTLQDEVEARVNKKLSHYEVMDNLTVLDTTGQEYSMIAVTKLVAVQSAMEYLTHSQNMRDLTANDAGKEQGQPSCWVIMFAIGVGMVLGYAIMRLV